jgi:2-methylcitrate dehydratase PrpD
MSVQEASSATPIAVSLAGFIAGLRYDSIPSGMIASAKRLVLDQLACELIGSTLPWVEPARGLVAVYRGAAGESTVVNHGDRVPAAEAAFLNATFGQACEMDDSAAGSSGHMGTGTVPVALAMGERSGADGRGFLTSMIAGYEVMYRLMRAVTPYAETRGFHSQSIAGPFAAAAVAGKMMDFDVERMTHALAIAGSHAGGTTEYDQSGGEVKRIHAGLGARGGVHAALLADFGLTGPATIVEGRRGFCNVFTDRGDPSRVTEGLGDTFHLDQASFKLFPTVGALHTTIVAVNRLVAEHDIAPEDVVSVRVGLSQHALLHGTAIRQPRDVVGAQFSLGFSVALALTRRGHDLALYTDRALWSDAAIAALMDRVEAYRHPSATEKTGRFSAVAITLADGRTVETEERYIKGSPLNPATPAELDAKVRRLCGAVLPPERVEALVRAVDSLETMKNVAELTALLVREPAAAKRSRGLRAS